MQIVHQILPGEATRALFRKVSENGFDYCAVGVKGPLPIASPQVFMENNYPIEWQERYLNKNYLTIDPTVKRALSISLTLMRWDPDLFIDAKSFWRDAQDHGLRHGISISSRLQGSGTILLSVSRSSGLISDKEMHVQRGILLAMLLDLVTTHSIDSLPRASRGPVRLSPRELEILRLSADGLTTAHIAFLLSIMPRSVTFHLSNIALKLEASNKTHSVAKAISLGLL
ncbi:MAG: autoinducer binding domain-containing protein [Burkholderiaceae bacterium]